MEELNFISLPLVLLLSLVGGPFLLRRAGYPAGKTVFGTLTGMMVLLAAWGMISAIQNRTGLQAGAAGLAGAPGGAVRRLALARPAVKTKGWGASDSLSR